MLPGLGEHVAPRWAIKGLPAAQLQLVKPISIQKHTTLLGGVRLCYLQKYDNPPQELRHSALRPVSKGYYEWLRVSPRELREPNRDWYYFCGPTIPPLYNWLERMIRRTLHASLQTRQEVWRDTRDLAMHAPVLPFPYNALSNLLATLP